MATVNLLSPRCAEIDRDGAFIDFRPFPKIPRLRRDCVITEKIDGTNALVYVDRHTGAVLAGSRTRWILPDAVGGKGSDNFGFAAWVQQHEDELRQLGPGYHYGEWYGKGIQRGYGLQDKRFALFHTRGIAHKPGCVEVVPTLFDGPFSDHAVSCAVSALQEYGSAAVPGFMKPEGIVVLHTAASVVFKVLCENDHIAKGA